MQRYLFFKYDMFLISFFYKAINSEQKTGVYRFLFFTLRFLL